MMNTTRRTPSIESRPLVSTPLPQGEASLQRMQPGWFEWWYRWTAPPEPALGASLQQREAARRGRLASTTLFWMTIFTLLPLPVAILSHNTALLVLLLVTLLVNLCGFLLNRKGLRTLAGVISVVVLGVGIALSLVANPGGLDVSNLPTFDLLAESTLVAVAFFPSWSVFVVVVINALFIVTDLLLERHTMSLGHLLSTSIYDVLVRPVILQVFVAVIVYIWVRSALQAIARADRAEEIIALSQDNAEQTRIRGEQAKLIVEEKQQFEAHQRQILGMLAQAANGNYTIQVPTIHNNELWQIAVGIMNMVGRLKRAAQTEGQLKEQLTLAVGTIRRLQSENERLVELHQGPERERM